MKLELMLNFNGNCREAGAFYAKVFDTEVTNIMTYSQVPPGQEPPDTDPAQAQADKDKILYSDIKIGAENVMLMDMPTGAPFFTGNNISPCVSFADKEELTKVFDGLKEGGKVEMDLCQVFFSEMYGMVTDRFGIVWQMIHYVPQV